MTGYTPDPRDLAAASSIGAARDALLARAAKYARWDGTQSIPALDADEILDALADDVMAEGDLGGAMRMMMERGWCG
jgi:predicted RNA-binding protein with PIN domain